MWNDISKKMFFLRGWGMVFCLMACFSLVGATSSPGTECGEPRFGGTMRIAMDAEPSGLDSMISSATLTYSVAWHIFENLFSLGDKNEVIPMLAESWDAQEEGKKIVINLRKGIFFHNGKEMTAEDVIPCLRRWMEVSGGGKQVAKNVVSLEALSPYTIQFVLKEPDAVLLPSLAEPGGAAIVMPKEIVEAAGNEPVKEFVGTGPYRFVDWKSHRFIKLQRFEDYKPLEGKPNGYGGRKTAYADELMFIPVPDKTVQAAGVEAGDFDYAYAANSDEYDRLKEVPGVRVFASEPRAWLVFPMNLKEGLTANPKIRQAIAATLDVEPILFASRGHKDFWRIDPGINMKETVWWTDAGGENYNQGNPEKARALLQEAGYDGTPLRFMASYEGYYNAALVAKSQLEKVGFVVDLQRFEPATESSRRKDPKLWDMTVTGFTKKSDPVLNSFMRSSYPGWWSNQELEEIKKNLGRTLDYDSRYAMIQRVQELFYEEIPYIKVGDYSTMRLLSDRVCNFTNKPAIFFWNMWLNR